MGLYRLDSLIVKSMRQSAKQEYTARQSNRETMSKSIEKREECGEKRKWTWLRSFQGLNAQAQAGPRLPSNFMPGQEGAERQKGSVLPWNYGFIHVLVSTRLASGGYLSCSDSWSLGYRTKRHHDMLESTGRPRHEIIPSRPADKSTAKKELLASSFKVSWPSSALSHPVLRTIRKQAQMRSAEQAGSLDLQMHLV